MARRRYSGSPASPLFPKGRPLRFDEKLVLNQWMLGLLDKKKFDQLAGPLKVCELEGLDENNVHRFLHQMKLLWESPDFPGDTLLGYDQNIVRHTLRLCDKRDQPIRWKYFQWLSLLFTEVYLGPLFPRPRAALGRSQGRNRPSGAGFRACFACRHLSPCRLIGHMGQDRTA